MSEIRVIESFVQGKNPHDARICEDAIVVTNHFAAVIDGATDKSGWTQDGKAGGRIAAERIGSAIETLPYDVTAEQAADYLSASLREGLIDPRADGPSASVAIYSGYRREIWRIGDVSYLLPGSHRAGTDRKLVDAVASDMRAAVIEAALKSGVSQSDILADDPGRRAILPLLTSQHVFRNSDGPWAFAAIDGRAVPRDLIEVTGLEPEDTEVILASDGYATVASTLRASEDSLQASLMRDPMCVYELRGTKGVAPGNGSFDDRAYLRIDTRPEAP